MKRNTPPSQRSNTRIVIGVLMIVFALYHAFALLRNLPGLLMYTSGPSLMIYMPILIVAVFLVVGVQMVQQGLGTDKTKRETNKAKRGE